MSRKSRTKRRRKGLQKFLVIIIALVIIGTLGKIFIYEPLKEKASHKMAEKLIQSEIAADTELTENVSAQEILDSMSEDDQKVVEQIMSDNISPETVAKASSYLASGDTQGLKDYAKETLSDEELQQIKDLYQKYKNQIPQDLTLE